MTTSDRAAKTGRRCWRWRLAGCASLAESELRLRRDLVEESARGHRRGERAGQGAGARARTWSAVTRLVSPRGGVASRERYVLPTRCAAPPGTAAWVVSLVARRGGGVVVHRGAAWRRPFRAAVLDDMGGGLCQIGWAAGASGQDDFPRSYREAQLASRFSSPRAAEDHAHLYQDLGRVPDPVRRGGTGGAGAVRPASGSGDLLRLRRRNTPSWSTTLSCYLECGGSYDATAAALTSHRSSLKYRLQRIREISGHDISDASTSFEPAARRPRLVHLSHAQT